MLTQDMREMERRKRVELIMNSRLFREELERIIESQIKAGNSSAGLLQQISDMVGSTYSGVNNHLFRSKPEYNVDDELSLLFRIILITVFMKYKR